MPKIVKKDYISKNNKNKKAFISDCLESKAFLVKASKNKFQFTSNLVRIITLFTRIFRVYAFELWKLA